jgi:hypothetical protein
MNIKQLSNPYSTGGGGFHFEAHIQASFVTLMLTGGYAPCLPSWPIKEIKLQGKIDGFDTDDLIIIIENLETQEQRKIIGQVKHTICFTKGDKNLSEFIVGAWNDFNKPNIFSKGKDIIALFTGPISATDSINLQWLLNQAKTTLNFSEFFRNVEQANFSPYKCSEKLETLQYHLNKANNDIELTKEELFSFLKHFYLLGYDLGNEFGVVLSLLQSHISQFYSQNPQFIWSRIVDFVESKNQVAGKITLDNIPSDLVEVFKIPTLFHIPEEFSIEKIESELIDWSKYKNAKELILATLIGSWDENSKSDIDIVQKILNESYDSWVEKIREILQKKSGSVSLKNGRWNIGNRVKLIECLNQKIFDNDLEKYKDLAISVLSEIDPSLKIPKAERYMASLSGDVLQFSITIRKGLAEGLAILGSNPDQLINTSSGKTNFIIISAIREIFSNADWRLWASLNSVIPSLAEAAPNEFMNIVEKALSTSPCPFDEVFAQEGNGMFGGNYLTGLLWALEGLAWDEKYLVRVCVILGELSSHDPGGNYTNRPINSLKTIFLPWYPQTLAPIEKRIVAIETLCKEFPEIGWKLLIRFLPNQHQNTSGSYKPKYRIVIPDSFEKGVTNQEYYSQISSYSDIAVRIAKNNPIKIGELLYHLENLPKSSFNYFMEIISSENLLLFSENDRLLLWNSLRKCIIRLQRFPEENKDVIIDTIVILEKITDRIKPSSPIDYYYFLFSDQDFELFEENDNWKEQQELLLKKRKKAISEIFEFGGIETLLKFANKVKIPSQVGLTLGYIGEDKIDHYLLPNFLLEEKREIIDFLSGYIWSRHRSNGWTWVDTIDKKSWSVLQLAKFFCYLPFSNENWERVDKQLGDKKNEYWVNVKVNPYQASGDLDLAIERLVEVKRPNAAIDCLYKLHLECKPINTKISISALKSVLLQNDSVDNINSRQIVGVIKALQKCEDITDEELQQIEWMFLPLLEHDRGASPINLELHLVTDPIFFCELVQLMYRSRNKNSEEYEITEAKKSKAENAWHLLNGCHIIPGTQRDGHFDEIKFKNWIQQVLEICTKSGHVEVAQITIGELLVNSPSDSDGLFINRIVAEILNGKDAEDMRTGYYTGIFNSRGVHSIDPTGAPELDLAQQFNEKAETMEKAGFFRLAKTFRDLAESNEREAKRIIDEHSQENDD